LQIKNKMPKFVFNKFWQYFFVLKFTKNKKLKKQKIKKTKNLKNKKLKKLKNE